MKKTVFLVLSLMLLCGTIQAATDYETFSTGKDWAEHMSAREKFISLLVPTLVFNQYDVRLRHSLPQYIYWIDNILGKNPQLENEDVNSIFASTIYLFEPENRLALKKMEMDFLRGDLDDKPLRLDIEEILKEISTN